VLESEMFRGRQQSRGSEERECNFLSGHVLGHCSLM